MSRAASAALLAGSAAVPGSRPARRVAWGGLLLGATLTDWLDGPVARRYGPTKFGRELDLEADSWLTLWAAVSAYRQRALPGWAMLAPAARYALLALRGTPPPGRRAWQRAAGAAQMTVLVGSLSPWRRVRRAARNLLPVAAAAQLSALAADLG